MLTIRLKQMKSHTCKTKKRVDEVHAYRVYYILFRGTQIHTCDSSTVGSTPPCQGGGRGFESRLSLWKQWGLCSIVFLCNSLLRSNASKVFWTFIVNNEDKRARIVTLIVLFVGVLLIAPLKGILQNEYFSTASNYLLLALFGCMTLGMIGRGNGPTYVKNKLLIMVVPAVLISILTVMGIASTGLAGILILVMIPVTILCARILFIFCEFIPLKFGRKKWYHIL